MEAKPVPEVELNSGYKLPMIGFGTGTNPVPPPHELIDAFLAGIRAGYRHFDTAALYGTEEPLGQALGLALQQGLIKSRSEIFVTTKLWCSDAHPDLVLPALRSSLQSLPSPFSCEVETFNEIHNFCKEDILPFDIKGTWEAMEECCKLGLAKSVGVSNFGMRKLSELLQHSTIPPAVLQVEMNVGWQQGNLQKFCKEKGIHVCAWSPLGANGASWGTNAVMESPILRDIATAIGRSVPQVALRWILQQGVTPIVRSSTVRE